MVSYDVATSMKREIIHRNKPRILFVQQVHGFMDDRLIGCERDVMNICLSVYPNYPEPTFEGF